MRGTRRSRHWPPVVPQSAGERPVQVPRSLGRSGTRPPFLVIAVLGLLPLALACGLCLAFSWSYSTHPPVQTDPCKLITKDEVAELLGYLPATQRPSDQPSSGMFRICFCGTSGTPRPNWLRLGIAEFGTPEGAEEAFEGWAAFPAMAVDFRGEVPNLGHRAVYRVAKSNVDYGGGDIHDTVEFRVVERTFWVFLEVGTYDGLPSVEEVAPIAERIIQRLPGGT